MTVAAGDGPDLRRAAGGVRRCGDGPAGVSPPALRARLPGRAGRLRDARGRHRRRPHGPRPWRGRLQDRREVRPRDPRAARCRRALRRNRTALCRPAGLRRQPQGGGGAAGSRPAVAPRGLRPRLPALLALPPPGHLPGDRAVVHRDGFARAARAGAPGDSRACALDPLVGTGADRGDDCQSSGLVHLAAAGLGRANPGDGLHDVRHRRAHLGPGGEGRGRVRRIWRRCLVRAAARGVRARGPGVPVLRQHLVRAREQHPRRVVRLRIEPRGGPAVPRGPSLAGRHLSGRQRPASRLVPQLAAGRHRHPRAAPRSTRCSPTASSWTSTGARCRSRSATRWHRRT
jgi:hypothetical protein